MDDLISRQAAVDDLRSKDPSQVWDTADVEVWVNELPSAQGFADTAYLEKMSDLIFDSAFEMGKASAQPDIIRCKDCKWWDKDSESVYGYCLAMKHGYHSKNWEIGIYRRYKGDFYCADAERRENR